MHATGTTGERRETRKDPLIVRFTPPSFLLPHSVPPTSQQTQSCTLGSIVLVGFTLLYLDFHSQLSLVLCRLSLTHLQKSRISDSAS